MTVAVLALAWLLGIAAAAFTGAEPAATVAAVGLLGAVSFAVRPRWSTFALIATGGALIFVAGAHYEATVPHPSQIARFNDAGTLRLRAIIDDEPDTQSSSRVYQLQVREAYIDGSWQPESGGVLMRAALFPEYDYGDLLEVEGKLEDPPALEGFDYKEYLSRRGIDSTISYPTGHVLDHDRGSMVRSRLIDLRSSLSDSLSGILPDPEANLATGILFGSRTDNPGDLSDDMRTTGTAHLVAVSGQNVVLLAALIIGALAWVIGRRNAAWLALAGVIVYAALVGGQPSVVRAAIMGGLYVIAIAIGRRNTAQVAITFAGALMTALDPQVVHDVAFQLSFSATLGLVLLAPALTRACESALLRWPAATEFPATRGLTEVATMSLAAIALTLPIIAMNFQRVSLAAPFANLLAVPAFIAVAATSAAAAIVGLILPGDAGFMAWIAWPPAAYMIGVIRLCADLPLASFELRGFHVEHAIVYYALLGAATLWLSRRPLQRPERTTIFAPARATGLIPVTGLAAVLILAAALVWLAVSAPSSQRLSVTFLDVGQGDSILIEGPAGHRILIDGGPSGEALTAALGRQLPFYDRRIDLLVLTHPQQDHLGGLTEVLDQYSVARVLSSPETADTAAYREWTRALAGHNVPRLSAQRGQTIDLGDGAQLAVLSPGHGEPPARPSNLNDASVVLRLTMDDVSFLLTGDITAEGEASLVRSGADLDATVLKIAHHGSATSTSQALLARAAPLVDVISVGAANRFGHPAPEVLDRLTGSLVLRTDQRGDIEISTDGGHLWIETQHPLTTESAR
ncbi:MAG TPA: DNA internalization-related competence protein ComEC/Rec2 [Dehalococcoidia bacterium]|nr:DNA internalization-related competence protein ComEC/Rec2 [Dehalococcoidia bacterium]